MSLLVLSAADVKQVVSSLDTAYLQELMARVFIAVSHKSETTLPEKLPDEDDIQMPHRSSIALSHHTMLIMPARLRYRRFDLEGTSVKIVSVPRKENDHRGLPATTLVLNEETGAVEAVVNSRELTALRNAAGSLLSCTVVGIRSPEHVVMFGAGKQIEMHINLFIRNYPSVKSCTIVNRNLNERAKTLHHSMASTFHHLRFYLVCLQDSNAVQNALGKANIIVCATSSTSPLFPSDWVPFGTHVILIGSYKPTMQEVEEELVRRAIPGSGSAKPRSGRRMNQVIMVDSRDACAKEAGDLIKAGVHHESMVEIGELLADDRRDSNVMEWSAEDGDPPITEFRAFERPVTIFKSVGVGLQDVVMAKVVASHARAIPDIGTRVDRYDSTV